MERFTRLTCAFLVVVSALVIVSAGLVQAQNRPNQPECLNGCARAQTACYRNECGGYPGTPGYDRTCGNRCVATFRACQKACKGK